MHCLLTALGSYGDVHPMIGLGVAMRDRGARVTIVANPHFEQTVDEASLGFAPVGTAEDYEAFTRQPRLWDPIGGFRLVLKTIAGQLLRPMYETLASLYVPGETVIGAHALDLASRLLHETHDAPVASLVYAPHSLWSYTRTPRVGGTCMGPNSAPWANRLQYWLGDKLLLRPLIAKPLNRLRRDLGLGPVGRLVPDFWYGTGATVGLFPDWFGLPQPDWPAGTRTTGFPQWNGPNQTKLTDEAEAFLASGPSPIVFTPGSANRRAEAFFASAAEACRLLGRRGALLTKYPEQLPKDLPEGVRGLGFQPLNLVLRHAAALVHHGGIGTCAQGLAAATPQVIQPMAFDQHDNADRLVRLGVAAEAPQRKLANPKKGGPLLAELLDGLLTSESVKDRCRQLASKCDGDRARQLVCDRFEKLLANSRTAVEELPAATAPVPSLA